jgi:hypothetical protein
MRKTLVACLLLFPSQALAGPPEVVSGRIVLDKVMDGLRRYRRETDPEKRIRWLEKLAPSRDPRVAVVLGELFERGLLTARAVGPDPSVAAEVLLYVHYVPGGGDTRAIFDWWSANEADLRRRAKLLPE